MRNEIFELFRKYGKMMASQPYPVGEEARLLLDTPQGVYGTKKGADLGNLTEADVVKMSDAHFATARSGMHARVISQTPYCQRCLREGKNFRAVLDDMAQIIGPEAVIVDTTGSKKTAAYQMARAIQKATGFFVKDRMKDGEPAGYTLTTGRNLYEAVVAMTVLEKAAEVALKAEVLGGCRPVSGFDARRMRKNYKENYSKAETEARAYEEKYGAEEEWDVSSGTVDEEAAQDLPESREQLLRQTLVDFGNRLVESGLVQGTWGNLSIRLDEKYMLVTPSGRDYSSLRPENMVKVEIKTLKHESTMKPTSEKGLHAEVYKRRPEAGAVIHTHAKYCCVFAAANQDMPVEDPEGKKIFGSLVKTAAYGNPGSKKLTKNTAQALGENFGCIMANHGMVTCGSDMQTAFENCRQMEQCAETYINRRFR